MSKFQVFIIFMITFNTFINIYLLIYIVKIKWDIADIEDSQLSIRRLFMKLIDILTKDKEENKNV